MTQSPTYTTLILRGEEQTREEEMARKSKEEGKIGAKL